MKKTKTIEVCDGCEAESDGDTWYECIKCKKIYCCDCILDHILEEGLVIEKDTE